MRFLWTFLGAVFLLGCSEEGDYRKYVLPNLKVCLSIYQSQMTYARARQCALEKCAFVKEKYGMSFTDEACERHMNALIPGLKK